MSYYFDFGQIEPDSIVKHLSSQGAFPPLNIKQFLNKFSGFNGELTSLPLPDQIDLVMQLSDYLARTIVLLHKNSQQIQIEKLANAKKVKDLQIQISEIQKKNKTFDLRSMTTYNSKIIKLQSWFRMILVRKKLIKKSTSSNDKVDPNKQLTSDFVKALRTNKITPEEFLRAIDRKGLGKIPVERFIEEIVQRKLVANTNQATRLAFIIDEDISGDITLVELQKTLNSYQLQVETKTFSEETLTFEQFSLIKLFNLLSQRSIEPHELFNAIDVDNNQQLSCDELTRFISTLLNTSDGGQKFLQDKDIRHFMTFLDLDRNGVITKGEFLRGFQKIEQIAKKNGESYKRVSEQESKEGKDIGTIESEGAAREIVRKMQQEGVVVEQFIKHVSTIAEPETRMVKLGQLLRQFQLSYPTITVEEIRSILKWIKVQAGGKYDNLELQVFISRFMTPGTETNSALYQTLRVIAANLKLKQLTPEIFISRHFFDSSPTLQQSTFIQVLSDVFQLPMECIVDLYNSLLITEQQFALKADFLIVLKSFEEDPQSGGSEKINLTNLSDFIKDYKPQEKRSQVASLISEKLKERKMTLLNVFKLASLAQSGQIKKEQILRAFEKLIPILDRQVIQVVFRKDQYATKEEFMLEMEVTESKELEIQQKDDLIRVLDQALLYVRASPSVVFQEADSNGDGQIEIRELAVVLNRIGIKLDEVTLTKIFKELDINGSGQLDQKEFYEIFRSSRAVKPVKQEVDSTLSRTQLLPTKSNLQSLAKKTVPSLKPLPPSSDLQLFLKQAHLPLKDFLSFVALSLSLTFDLRELATVLSSKGVPLPQIIQLYSLLDPNYTGIVSMPELLNILDSDVISTVDYKVMCKIIYASCSSDVAQYFEKQSSGLAKGEQKLRLEDVQRECARLFLMTEKTSASLFEIIKTRYGKTVQGVLVSNMYEHLQEFYNQFHHFSKDAVIQQDIKKQSYPADNTQNAMKQMFLRLLGADPSPISLSAILQAKYSKPCDFSLAEFSTIFKQNLSPAECKNLYQFIQETRPSSRSTFLNTFETVSTLSEIETSLARVAVKEITVKLEGKIQSVRQWVVEKVRFVQEEGVISRYGLEQGMVGAGLEGIEAYELRVLIWKMGEGVQQMQEYFKIYTKEKEISTELYFKYFAYILDKKQPEISTAQIIQNQLIPSNLSPQRYFLSLLRLLFPSMPTNSSEDENLLDLYDSLSLSLSSDFSIPSLLALFSSRLDLHRPSLSKSSRFKLRASPELFARLQQSLTGRPIHRLLDSIAFTAGGVIPTQLLEKACAKMMDGNDQKMFILMCDVNGDGKIEVEEFVEFARQIQGEKAIDCAKVVRNLATIIESTSTDLSTFLKLHNSSLPTTPTFTEWSDLIMNLFRISRFETYIVYRELKGEITKVSQEIDKIVKLIADDKRMENEVNQKAEDKIRQEIEKKVQLSQQKQIEANGQKQPRLSNAEVLKIFLNNFKNINSIPQIKQACLKLKNLKKVSPQLRARFFTKRACDISEMYFELSRPDPEIPQEIINDSLLLTASEKVLVSVLAVQKVDRNFECNVYRFKQLLDRLTATNVLDFQMLHAIVTQRYPQIEALLLDDFLTIADVIEKIKQQTVTYKGDVLIQQTMATSPARQVLSILQGIGAKLRESEIKLIEKEFIEGERSKVALFLAQCGLHGVEEQPFTKVFSTLEQAKIEIQLIKKLLSEHPYLDLNQDIINDESQQVQWGIVESFDASFSNRLSPLHQNQMLLDCIIQLCADDSSALSKLIVYQDPQSEEHPVMLVHLDSYYILCDMTLPFIFNPQTNTRKPGFSYHSSSPCLPLIEKALAVWASSYVSLGQLTSLPTLQRALNLEQLEPYPLGSGLDPYVDLLNNFFEPGVMTHCTYVQTKACKGLDRGRVMVVKGLIRLKTDNGIKEERLVVVRNPFSKGDTRLENERWSKGYLQNEAKNKKEIDMIVKGYGYKLLEKLKANESNLYLYDFNEIFDKKQTLYLNYSLSPDDPAFSYRHQHITFTPTSSIFTLNLQPPAASNSGQFCFSYLIIDYDDDTPSSFKLTYNQKSWTFSTKTHGRLYCQTLMLPYNNAISMTLTREGGEPGNESVEVALFSKAGEKVEMIISGEQPKQPKEVKEEIKQEKKENSNQDKAMEVQAKKEHEESKEDSKLNDSKQNIDEAYILEESGDATKKLLFVCIHNSARSQMAEAYFNSLKVKGFEAQSAGLEPGTLNPLVVSAMKEVGIDISQAKTKSVADILKNGQTYTYVITVCDEANAERCPQFPGKSQKLHWGFPDPSVLAGTDDERMIATRKIRDQIHKKVVEWSNGIIVGDTVVTQPQIPKQMSIVAKETPTQANEKEMKNEQTKHTIKIENEDEEEEYEEYDVEEDLERADDDKVNE